MTSGVYKRTPEMKTGKHKRTPEMNAANSKAKTGVPNSQEHNAAISAGTIGVPKSPEHCDAISIGKSGVPLSNPGIIAKGIKDKAMKGGHDILKHHYIYDHYDLSKYIMEMTRSQHMSLHQNMKSLGLKVPHINTGHENEEELKLMEYIRKVESEPKGL